MREDLKTFLGSLQSFTWVSWGYLPITDILCRPQLCRFLSSFLCCYVFSKWNIYFFVLVFSDPIQFSVSFISCTLFSLSSNFYPSPSSIFEYPQLSLSPSIPFFVCVLLSFLLSSIFLLWFSLFIIYFLFLLLSLSLSSIFLLGFHPLSFFACVLLYSLFSVSFCVCVFYYYYPVLFFCIFYLSIFICLFCLFFYIFLSLLFILFCSFSYSLWLSCSNPWV